MILTPAVAFLANDHMTKIDEAYNQGFNDALKWMATVLRRAAATVETTLYADFERRPADGGGVAEKLVFRGVTRTGQLHFATKLRDVASEIETAITQEPSDGPQT